MRATRRDRSQPTDQGAPAERPRRAERPLRANRPLRAERQASPLRAERRASPLRAERQASPRAEERPPTRVRDRRVAGAGGGQPAPDPGVAAERAGAAPPPAGPRAGGPGLASVLRRAVVVLLVLGVGGFLIDGANRPADPYLVRPHTGAAGSPGPAGAARTASVGGPAASALAPVAGAGPVRPPGLAALPAAELTVTTAGVGRQRVCVLEATTTAERDQGLMNQTTLGGFAGMAFVFGRPSLALFYMRDTPMALSIAWFGPGGAFLASRDMPPCAPDAQACPTYGPGRQYQLALEVPRGRLAALGIGPGSAVHLGGSCG